MPTKSNWELKVIPDPISGVVDIGPVLPMVEVEEFQALAGKLQLGMTYLVFRSALHTRFNHSVGAYNATCLLSDRWLLEGVITKEERDALAAYALWHDIGHPAFSHVTEDFCLLDDDQMTLFLVREKLKGVIEACGVNPALVEAFASHQNPLYRAVHDRNLGTEKLDYLERDGFYTILSRPAGLDYLRNYIYWVNGEVAIDEKVVEAALDVQTFYMKMYKGVYFRKALVIAQRMFHKMVWHLICGGELCPEQLPHMTDAELLGLLSLSSSRPVGHLYKLLRNRELFREAIVIRQETFIHETRVYDKPIHVIGISQSDVDKLVRSPRLEKKNHTNLKMLEDGIADIAHIPRGDILVVPVFNPERFRAKDIFVYGSDHGLHSLRERRPEQFRSMEETARSYFALRICTLEVHRKLLSTREVAREVFRFIMSQL